MSTVAIIGAGDLGGAIAQSLAARDCVRRILFVDAMAQVAAGKALDIQQSGAVAGFHTRLDATDDFSRVIGCAVCIVADRAAPDPPGGQAEWRGEEGLAMLARMASSAIPLVFAGASQAELISLVAREARLPRTRLIGSAPEALASAVRAIVAMEARCSPGEVMLAVLGVPPSGFVVPWGDASIGGYALEQVLEQVQLARIQARAARLWPPGPYALGAAAARVTEAILQSSRRSFAVLTMLGGEFGIRDRVGVVPALLSTQGIVHTRTPPLNARERVQIETALLRV